MSESLRDYMFKDVEDAEAQAGGVAGCFADYQKFRSHALGINRDTAREHGLRVTDLEDDTDLQDAVLSVHHTTLHTFAGRRLRSSRTIWAELSSRAFSRSTSRFRSRLNLSRLQPFHLPDRKMHSSTSRAHRRKVATPPTVKWLPSKETGIFLVSFWRHGFEDASYRQVMPVLYGELDELGKLVFYH